MQQLISKMHIFQLILKERKHQVYLKTKKYLRQIQSQLLYSLKLSKILVQAWVYASVVNFPPVSIKVLKAEIAYHQSDLEKKSALTLNDPQKVQMKGKQAIKSQTIIKIVLKVFKLVDFLSRP